MAAECAPSRIDKFLYANFWDSQTRHRARVSRTRSKPTAAVDTSSAAAVRRILNGFRPPGVEPPSERRGVSEGPRNERRKSVRVFLVFFPRFCFVTSVVALFCTIYIYFVFFFCFTADGVRPPPSPDTPVPSRKSCETPF